MREEAELAQLGEAQAGPHAPTPAGLRGLQLDRHAERRGPGRCPGCRRRAGRPRPRRARCRSRCRRRSRSRASSGSPRGRAPRARPASPARGSPCAAPRRGGPTAAPRPRCGAGGSTSPCSRPWAAMASCHRSRRKCSLHSWNVPPARHTCSMTGPSRRSPRLTRPSMRLALGSCHLRLHALRAPFAASRSRPTLRRSSSSVFMPNHWNGVNAFGTNPPTLTVTEPLRPLRLGQLDAAAGQVDDAEGVLVGLRGEPGEEVELHALPALAERGVDRGEEVLLGDQLVDHLAHAPRAGLGGEREARAAGPLDLGGHADREGVDAQARQAHRHVAAAGALVASVSCTTSSMPEKSAVDRLVRATSS